MDRRQLALLDALKLGAQERTEVRLYARGKLPGLFTQRTRANAEIANQAIAEGLLEIIRVETVGKTSVEWVRVTTKGLDHLIENESPLRALKELREALSMTQDGFPQWVADMNALIKSHMQRYADEVSAMRQRLDQLAARVEEAIVNVESGKSIESPSEIAWQPETLDFLERRQHVGLGPRCPLADLFEWLKDRRPALTIKEFHAGLKRMQETKCVVLQTSAAPGDTPGPEYAMLIGSAVYYYVARSTAEAA